MCDQRNVAVVDERFIDEGEMKSAFCGIGDVDYLTGFFAL